MNTEISTRELHSNLLLAMTAASLGHVSLIFDQRVLPILVSRAIPPASILHTKSLHGEKSMANLIRRAKGLGIFISSIDQEFPVFEKEIPLDGFILERFDHDSVAMADVVFTWGADDFAKLVENFPDYANSFVLGGSARVDLWRNPSLPLPRSAAKWERHPFVLLSSNLSINTHYRHWEIYRGLSEAGLLEKDPGLARRFFEELSESAKILGEFIILLERLARNFPDLDFVVRPHPTEDPEAWLTLVPPLSNIHVSREGPLSAWISRAKLVVQHKCTSGVEAYLARVPTVSYRPPSFGQPSDPSDDVGVRCENPEQVIDELSRILGPGLDQFMLRQEATAQWLSSRLSLQLSSHSQIVVDQWTELAGSTGRSVFGEILVLMRYWLFGWLGATLFRLRRMAFRLQGRGDYSLGKFSPLTRQGLQEISEAIRLAHQIPKEVRIWKVFSRGAIVFRWPPGAA